MIYVENLIIRTMMFGVFNNSPSYFDNWFILYPIQLLKKSIREFIAKIRFQKKISNEKIDFLNFKLKSLEICVNSY